MKDMRFFGINDVKFLGSCSWDKIYVPYLFICVQLRNDHCALLLDN